MAVFKFILWRNASFGASSTVLLFEGNNEPRDCYIWPLSYHLHSFPCRLTNVTIVSKNRSIRDPARYQNALFSVTSASRQIEMTPCDANSRRTEKARAIERWPIKHTLPKSEEQTVNVATISVRVTDKVALRFSLLSILVSQLKWHLDFLYKYVNVTEDLYSSEYQVSLPFFWKI